MNANWVNKIEIGTTATTANPPVWTYATLCEGIESMNFAENEQNKQYFFLCGEGFAHNEVTGAAPELVITGRRIVGNTAQDFITGKQFALGATRNTSVKITSGGKVILETIITCLSLASFLQMPWNTFLANAEAAISR